MTGSDFDWMVSNHAVWGVEGASKSVCVRRFSPSALSRFRFHLSPFPQKRLILRLAEKRLLKRVRH